MNLSNSQRVLKLIRNLATNPDLVIPYLKTNIFQRKLPIDYPYPWWSFRAIQFLDSQVEGKRIFEYGTGGSTIRYSPMAHSIVAVEDARAWAKMVQSKIEDKKLENITLIEEPFDFDNPEDFEVSGYLHALDKSIYDIIIIDGQNITFTARPICFYHAEKFVREGTMIVVDDFWRYESLLNKNRAKGVKVFESVGPCRFGVTSTAVFFY